MSDSSFRRVNEFLLDSPCINSLKRSSSPKFVDRDLWRVAAGDKIADHTHALVEGRSLVICTDSPIWAHTVNQQRITLMKALRQRGFILDNAQVRSKPSEPKRAAARILSRPTPIPERASRALKQTADTIDDEALRHALLRLSRRSMDAAD